MLRRTSWRLLANFVEVELREKGSKGEGCGECGIVLMGVPVKPSPPRVLHSKEGVGAKGVQVVEIPHPLKGKSME